MDTRTLIADAKARFSHNSLKHYLKEKYQSKLVVASQGGLWCANLETINFLNSMETTTVVLVDTFGNPVLVNRKELLNELIELYNNVMNDWYNEYKELESNR